jgi:hypothetical protein
MNTFVKAAIAGVLSLTATGAFAATGAPWSNSSNLVLVVENATTHAAYALDTGISLDSLLPTSSLVSGAVLNQSIVSGINQTISASPALTAFLAANPAAGDLWTLEGGQYNGGGTNPATSANTRPVASAKAAFTSAIGTTNNATVSNKIASNLAAFENGLQADIHAPNGGALGLHGLESATETSQADVLGGVAGGETRYSFLTANDFSSLGNSVVQLFGFTGNGNAGVLQSYILGTASLSSSGLLTISTVPLPAAVWLFGSGLLGLFGVSRRRTAVA